MSKIMTQLKNLETKPLFEPNGSPVPNRLRLALALAGEEALRRRLQVKNVAVMGSTGSVGRSTLQIARAYPDKFHIKVLAAKKNAALLVEQAREFRPEMVCIFDSSQALDIEKKLKRLRVRVTTGIDGLREAARCSSVDEVIFAMVGAVGLIPIFESIRAGKIVAIANKEPLVMAGKLLVEEAKKYDAPLLPIDSEHSGLWQCLEACEPGNVKKLILTSSGGPFLRYRGSLQKVTVRQALKHPKWKMGPKITIDSATLMNKGLEVIEAANLFQVPSEKVEVLIHPEAIVHAMVELVDGSHLAHLGVADMRLPIQYALSFPDRLVNHVPQLDLAKHGAFHFEKPDMKRFPCLRLGYEASRTGGSMPAVLNAANEVAVEAFLTRKTGFTGIPKAISKVMKKHTTIKHPSLEQLLAADAWAREQTEAIL